MTVIFWQCSLTLGSLNGSVDINYIKNHLLLQLSRISVFQISLQGSGQTLLGRICLLDFRNMRNINATRERISLYRVGFHPLPYRNCSKEVTEALSSRCASIQPVRERPNPALRQALLNEELPFFCCCPSSPILLSYNLRQAEPLPLLKELLSIVQLHPGL